MFRGQGRNGRCHFSQPNLKCLLWSNLSLLVICHPKTNLPSLIGQSQDWIPFCLLPSYQYLPLKAQYISFLKVSLLCPEHWQHLTFLLCIVSYHALINNILVKLETYSRTCSDFICIFYSTHSAYGKARHLIHIYCLSFLFQSMTSSYLAQSDS